MPGSEKPFQEANEGKQAEHSSDENSQQMLEDTKAAMKAAEAKSNPDTWADESTKRLKIAARIDYRERISAGWIQKTRRVDASFTLNAVDESSTLFKPTRYTT